MKVVAAVVCDLERSPVNTVSRLSAVVAGRSVLQHTLTRVAAATRVDEIVLLAPAAQHEALHAQVAGLSEKIRVLPLVPRRDGLTAHIQAARAWNLAGWRGGAGQFLAFDEDYHPASVAAAVQEAQADHVLCVSAHAALIDPALLDALVDHHLNKNHELRLTFTAAPPGLGAIVLQGSIAAEMGAAGIVPGQLLAYDPKRPSFDPINRDPCMQVDPALAKLPARFLADTERSLPLVAALLEADDPRNLPQNARAWLGRFAEQSPVREIEIELTADRRTRPPGCPTLVQRQARGALDAAHWVRFFESNKFADDVQVTFAGDGDPLLYDQLHPVLVAAKVAGIRAVTLVTDLVTFPDSLARAVEESLLTVLSVNLYGMTPGTYQAVAGHEGHAAVLGHLDRLDALRSRQAGLPLVVPRMLKTRDTIPEMEPFFDFAVGRYGWATFDGPSDRAGSVPFAGGVDMSPATRRPCRRINERVLVRCNGTFVACDQDPLDRLNLGHLESANLQHAFHGPAMQSLRAAQQLGQWNVPCGNCREWHRP